MASAQAVEAAKAVNSLMHFSSGDQQALLEVIGDYFTSPSTTEADNSDIGDDSDDPESGT